MPSLHDLERRYRAADRELNDAVQCLAAARNRLIAHPVSEAAYRKMEAARAIARDLLNRYDVAQDSIAASDRKVADARWQADRLRSQLNRLWAYRSPGILVLVCVAEVLVLLGISALVFRGLPLAIAIILFLFFAAIAITATIGGARYLSQASAAQTDFLSDELQIEESRLSEQLRVRERHECELDRARSMWRRADKEYRLLKDEVQVQIDYDRALARYDDAHAAYERARTDFDQANVERRMRLLRTNWRYLADQALERFIQDVFEALGYATSLTKISGDQGIDVIATKGNRRVGVQCKGYTNSVGNKAVQEAVAGGKFYKCDVCIALTTSTFTSGAKELAVGTECVLIEGEDIPRLIQGQLGF
jgi:hypothetical protein